MKKIDLACIIDDDPIFIFGTKRMMELTNFCRAFLVFNNGKDALDHLTATMDRGDTTPEVILLDLNMPIMDGWEFLEEFIKTPTHKQITIFIVTSSIDPADMNRAKRYGSVSNYVIKPITQDKLREMLQEV